MKYSVIKALTPCVTAVLLLTGCAILRPNISFPYKPAQAVWVWNTDELCSEKAADTFVAFCKAHQVGMVFLYLNGDFSKIKYLISACSGSNIIVHALTGTPEMAKSENHIKVYSFIAKVTRYNDSCSRKERITGIHLDIEPYLLDEFKSGATAEVLTDYVDLIKSTKTYLLKRDSRMAFGADIPFWFDSQNEDGTAKYDVESGGKSKPVYQHVIDNTDYICVMAYRNKLEGKDGIIELSKDELEYSGASGKKLFVGLETGSGEGIPEKTTFAKKDVSILNECVTVLVEMLSDEPCFSGVAIHHYKAWRSLGE